MAAMKALGWERVIIVYTDSDYARDTMLEFVHLSEERNICVVGTVALPATRSIPQLRSALEDIERYDVIGAVYIGDQLDMVRVCIPRFVVAVLMMMMMIIIAFLVPHAKGQHAYALALYLANVHALMC